eukprot:SM000220S07070  [mRNA]  locus=s220:219969:223928:- [translate_table: standard]
MDLKMVNVHNHARSHLCGRSSAGSLQLCKRRWQPYSAFGCARPTQGVSSCRWLHLLPSEKVRAAPTPTAQQGQGGARAVRLRGAARLGEAHTGDLWARAVKDWDADAGQSLAQLLLPAPPAGFILDSAGEVVLVAPAEKRVVTLVDPATGWPLECVVRRSFASSSGVQLLLVLPLDVPLQIFAIEGGENVATELGDEELKGVLPGAAYAMAKKSMHLLHTGFCLTARGALCYSPDNVTDLQTAVYVQVRVFKKANLNRFCDLLYNLAITAELGMSLGGSLTEGVEICRFQVKGREYLIFTPFNPVMFVVQRDVDTGEIGLADEELLENEAVISAIEEENDFQELVVSNSHYLIQSARLAGPCLVVRGSICRSHLFACSSP